MDEVKKGDIIFYYKKGIGIVICAITSSNMKVLSPKRSVIHYDEHYVEVKDMKVVPKGLIAKVPCFNCKKTVNCIVKDKSTAKCYYKAIMEYYKTYDL